MASKVLLVSDLSGKPLGPDAGRLVVRLHPEITRGLPLELDVSRDDLADAVPAEVVFCEWRGNDGDRQPLVFAVEAFEQLFRDRPMASVMADAARHRREERQEVVPRRRGGAQPGHKHWCDPTDYETIDRAGEPHGVGVTQAERHLVQAHLEEVNARLRAKGMRQIDPHNSVHRKMYGLSLDWAKEA